MDVRGAGIAAWLAVAGCAVGDIARRGVRAGRLSAFAVAVFLGRGEPGHVSRCSAWLPSRRALRLAGGTR